MFDTSLGGYLLDPTANGYALSQLTAQYLNEAVEWTEKSHEQARNIIHGGGGDCRLYPVMTRPLCEKSVDNLFYTIELPLAEVLAEMEAAGIQVDREAMRKMSPDIGAKVTLLIQEIYLLAGEEFNVNSTKTARNYFV